jgi:tetratricopeptide (TPR) repeat protein
MDLFGNLLLAPMKKKGARYHSERKKFQKALEQNPRDQSLRAQLVKLCLYSHFTGEGVPEEHLSDALAHYEEAVQADHFDPSLYYLVGRYYQDKNDRKAQAVYLEGVRHFNRYIEQNPGLKGEHVEIAYALALNFVSQQSGQSHPDLEQLFKTIRKSYPLHNKFVELENELRHPDPDPERVQRLVRELKDIKEAARADKAKRFSKASE